MRVKLYKFWEQLTGSFWFVPAFMVVVAILLAFLTLFFDRLDINLAFSELPWIYSGSPDGARSILSTVASSMISVAGLTFSITMVTLSLASSQLGPRLLNNFMRDFGNQIVLGTFISIFTYCLLILRSIRSLDEVSFVPHISLTVAIVLAIVSLGVLIYFFHHVSMMIQAQNLIANIGQEMRSYIERMFEDEQHTPYENQLRSEDDIPEDFEEQAHVVKANTSGFLQAIDYEGLLDLCHEQHLLLKMLFRPGDFIAVGSDMVAVYSTKDTVSSEIEDKIHDAFATGAVRLRLQDIEYSVDQLVEVAVRALSPGINDPFTAIACLDQFSANFSRLAQETLPSGYHYDEDDELRIISDVVKFNGLVDAAFNQIRQHSKTDVAVTIRLLEVIATILSQTNTAEKRQALLEQAEMVKRASQKNIQEKSDLQDIMQRYENIMKIVDDS